MRRKQNFERIYVKYAVKSCSVFYLYLFGFIGIFLIASAKMHLEKRQIYEAQIQGSEIAAVCDAKINLSDERVYVYTDKNQEVFLFHVEEAEYADGVMRFVISEAQTDISGNIMLEVVEGNDSLFQRIFAKAGKTS